MIVSNLCSNEVMSAQAEYAIDADAVPELRAPAHRVIVIERRRGWRMIDFKEILPYRDLFRLLVWRDVKARYSQSALGVGWAVVQPLATMLVFTIVFGLLARVASDGMPYALFSLAALAPWTYFSNALISGSESLITAAPVMSKVYFPRLLLPLAPLAAKLLDFGISLLMLGGLMAWYGVAPTWQALWLPLPMLIMLAAAAGLTLWLSALAVQYRDVKHALGFSVQLMMYASPVVYSASAVPERFRLFYALNPMVGVIESFRAMLLGAHPVPWDQLAVGGATALAALMSGCLYFRRREPLFADVA